MDEVVPFAKIICGDARHDVYGGRVTTDTIQHELVEMRTSPKMPEIAAHQIALAKQLCVAGFFFYDLYAVAVHQTAVACEVALRERFVADLNLPIAISRSATTSMFEVRPSSDLIVERLRQGWRLAGFSKEFCAAFRQLVGWAMDTGVIRREDEGWWLACVDLRNMLAHGSHTILPVNFPLGVLRRTIWMLNELFPHPDTQAHDGSRRAAADERVARDDEELRRWLSDSESGNK